jgi:Tfp pilus assembly protein PilN
MIQFNLLPDVKLEYIKAQRTKRLVMSVAVIASLVALAVFLLLLVTVDGLQKKNLSDLNRDIKTDSAKLQSTPDLNKILTIQNQLGSLTSLHDQDPTTSRLFDYLGQVTPSTVTLNSASADFTANTLNLAGAAPDLDDINTFVDTLKFTTYKTSTSSSSSPAFSDVVLSSFSRSTKNSTYSITLTFDPAIFSNSNTVSLTVPNAVTTRSITEQPSALFETNTEGTK